MKKGFTLAEVLITLAIIGVVAALTIPGLIQNNRTKALETGLKKANSIISQAVLSYQLEYGEPLNIVGLRRGHLKEHLLKQFKTIRDCGFGDTDAQTACIPNNDYLDNPESRDRMYTTFNGRTLSRPPFDDGQFILNDGMILLLEAPNENPNSNIYISVDVNGFYKMPNRLGQDLFMFQIDEKGVLRPMGVKGTRFYSDTDEYCSKDSTSNMNGAGCTYKALTDSNFWKNLP